MPRKATLQTEAEIRSEVERQYDDGTVGVGWLYGVVMFFGLLALVGKLTKGLTPDWLRFILFLALFCIGMSIGALVILIAMDIMYVGVDGQRREANINKRTRHRVNFLRQKGMVMEYIEPDFPLEKLKRGQLRLGDDGEWVEAPCAAAQAMPQRQHRAL